MRIRLRTLVAGAVASASLISVRAVADPDSREPVAPGARAESAHPAVPASAQSGLAVDFSAASLSTAALLYPNQESESQETNSTPAQTSDWRFIVQLYWWIPLQIKGPIEVGPTSTDSRH